jgi:glucokinase
MTHAIGIDFGGTTIKSGLVCEGRILEHGPIIDTQHFGSADAIIDGLVELIENFRKTEPGVVGVGIGLPGLIDSENGIVHQLTNVAGWKDVALRTVLRDRIGLPVTIENDANAMAYGEFKYGAAKGARHVVCITLGTGVGGALILDGRLYRGAQMGAGEIGHMSVDYKGRPGPYGNFGGLEEYVGNQQIAERAAERYQAAGQMKLAGQCTPLDLDHAAQAGDPIAKQMWEDLGDEIGAALANVVWALNPDVIVIGGGVGKAGDVLFDPIRRSVKSRTAKVFHEFLRIVPATLSNDAGIIGNAALAVEYAGA